jgi:hypothetical protein
MAAAALHEQGRAPLSPGIPDQGLQPGVPEELDAAQAEENIDYFHMHQAHTTIAGWFAKQDGAAVPAILIDEMFRFLSTSVRVIWYEVPENEEPIPCSPA